MKRHFFTSGLVAIFFSLSLVAHATIWPDDVDETLQITMPINYEPSGITWNTETDKLFVVSDNGKLTQMNMDGSDQVTVNVSGDNEAVTIVDPASGVVYIGQENPDSIVEYDWNSKEKGKIWDLTSVMTGANNSGLEGLTFVPNGYHPFRDSAHGGVFYAGIQRAPILNDENSHNDYLLYAFDINLDSSREVIEWWGIDLPAGLPQGDVSDLYFSGETELLYVLFDGSDRLIEIDPSSMELVEDYSGIPFPGDQQEGILVIPTDNGVADIYFAYDRNFHSSGVVKYSNYVIPFVGPEVIDEDDDGVAAELDCNDSDPTVWELQTYYKDRDRDGLGNPKRSKTICSLISPNGYVDNSDDAKDWDFDNDGIGIKRDCDDTDPSIGKSVRYLEDADGDGLGNKYSKIFVCDERPENYVKNGADCDDTDALIGKKKRYFEDADGDGLGNEHVKVKACERPEGYVENKKDEDDNSYNLP
ncbi:MAG: hypothetical protein HOJ35_06870 [Bdellovibrionales bacterium]|nr:hypothetical protein [Bdellovibrionales bacterium]